MSQFLGAELSYYILPGRPRGDFSRMALYEQAFTFWQEFWEKTLTDLGLDRRKLTADDFLRQDLITLLCLDEKIIGMHLYTFFPVCTSAAVKHSYFKRYYNEEFIRILRARGVRTAMSMEYFSIHPDFRSRKAGASLGQTIGTLGARLGFAKGADALIGSARTDVPAATMAYEIGATPVVTGLVVNERPTDLLAFFPGCLLPPKDVTVRDLISRLWQERIDLTGTNSPVLLKSVA